MTPLVAKPLYKSQSGVGMLKLSNSLLDTRHAFHAWAVWWTDLDPLKCYAVFIAWWVFVTLTLMILMAEFQLLGSSNGGIWQWSVKWLTFIKPPSSKFAIHYAYLFPMRFAPRTPSHWILLITFSTRNSHSIPPLQESHPDVQPFLICTCWLPTIS